MSSSASRSLILLSCSHAKLGGGRLFDAAARQILRSLRNQREALIKKRRRLLGLLHGESGRLYDEDQKGGFRNLRPCNRSLVAGPDFDGSISDQEIYLPAYERYNGRFFDQLTRESSDFWSEIRGYPVEVVFVSGLYGLVLWDEPIQDYDCHLADYTRNGRERSVREIWGGVLTPALCDFITTEARGSAPIAVIYDLLSEEEYQNAFRWKRIEELGLEVRHRVFRHSHGPDILTDLATILAKELPRFCPDASATLEPGKWYELGSGSSQVRFERYVFGELDHVQLSLKESRPFLNRVPHQTLEDLCLAEALWRKVRRTRNMPLGSMVISFATAVEGYLRSTTPALKDKMLGAAAHAGGHVPEIVPIANDLKRLNSLRGRAVHRLSYDTEEARLNRDDVKEAQRLAYQVIERLVEKR